MSRLFKAESLHQKERGAARVGSQLTSGATAKAPGSRRGQQRGVSNAIAILQTDDDVSSSFAEAFSPALRFGRTRETKEHGYQALLIAESELEDEGFASKDRRGNSNRAALRNLVGPREEQNGLSLSLSSMGFSARKPSLAVRSCADRRSELKRARRYWGFDSKRAGIQTGERQMRRDCSDGRQLFSSMASGGGGGKKP